MRYIRFAVAAAVLLGSIAEGSAQSCTAPAQPCAAGPNGWGGCYVPGPAQCHSGMICETGASVCPPGKNGEGSCYDPRVARCDDGAVAANPGLAPATGETSPAGSVPPQAAEGGEAGPCRSAAGEDRVAILNALRGPVSSDLKVAVEFAVERARICGAWAFVLATPQRKGGGAPRWAGTVCAGDTSHLAGGLMRKRGAAWSLVEYALCPSDVAWSDWPDKFSAPPALFEE